ncbi:glycosyltransferase family 4 protein [Lacrimispora saccharolytica]|uniref:glycosyltransferase family 4 protein n=1 Tax=Lacrimispora saccharolytica TaxID=84030 RepID=UPI00265D2B06|nr:glycosyltransferase family 4 protein [Lacrimispora saccharolytica]MCF2657187.1 glycosyltransferase family 4 protein [Lacrimispora saccharolytica]
MKILIIRSYASVLNTNTYNLQHVGLARAFNRKGHQCDIVYWVGDGEEREDTVTTPEGSFSIYWLKGRVFEKSVVFDKAKIDKMISEYDIVQIEEYEQYFSCYLSLKYPNKVVIYHGPYKCDFNKRYYIKSALFDLVFAKKMQNKKVQFITKTAAAKRTMEEKGFTDIVVSPVGLDLSKFNDSGVNYQFKSEPGVFKLLYIGEICRRRDTLFLIKVISELKHRGINAKLTIVGKGKQKYVSRCKELIGKLGLTKEIKFLGSMKQDTLPDVYYSHDVFVLPTKFEIFGMVLLEAMFLGRPIVTSKSGGSDELIRNGENGIIVDSFDVMLWADKIQALYMDQFDTNQMMRQARADVLQHYTWDESVDIFIDTYKKVLNRAKK